MASAPTPDQQPKINLIDARLQSMFSATGRTLEGQALGHRPQERYDLPLDRQRHSEGPDLLGEGLTDDVEHTSILNVHENMKVHAQVEVQDAASRALARLAPLLADGEIEDFFMTSYSLFICFRDTFYIYSFFFRMIFA